MEQAEIVRRAVEAVRAICDEPCPESEHNTDSPPAPPWPHVSIATERRFGQPHAKLFPFIGRKVRTPNGPGMLVQVFAERVTVLLDSQASGCGIFDPGEIEPANQEVWE